MGADPSEEEAGRRSTTGKRSLPPPYENKKMKLLKKHVILEHAGPKHL